MTTQTTITANLFNNLEIGGLYDVLEKIRQKPGLYLGKPSLTTLRNFLTGYVFARRELGIGYNWEERDFYENFQGWLELGYSEETSASWYQLILQFSRDEKDAFEQFFDLLENFKNRDRDADSITRKSSIFIL